MTRGLQPTTEADFSSGAFALDGGGSLPSLVQSYAVYGDLDAMPDRVVLVCHALSGSARVADWWAELTGPGLPFDPSRWVIVCANVIGSCYGSTGPRSIDPATGRPWGGSFPVVSINDMVRAQAMLLDHLGIAKVHAAVGGSIGGLQALAWAARYPALHGDRGGPAERDGAGAGSPPAASDHERRRLAGWRLPQ